MRARPRFGIFSSSEPLPLRASFGRSGDEVGREFDFAVLQVHCVAQIDDALVVRIGYRNRKVNASGDALVGSGVAEALAVENIRA